MGLALVAVNYAWWHYTGAIADLSRNFADFVAFLNNFFSIPFLVRNLFAPVKRLGEAYPKGLDVQGFFETLIVNTLMRFVGFLLRVFLIIFGTLAILAATVCFAVLLIAWLALPLILAFLLVLSARLILA